MVRCSKRRLASFCFDQRFQPFRLRFEPWALGDPNPSRICTSHVERQNLTMRMQIRRFTRLTNGFSKKFENHWAALALYFAYYNFCRIHSSIRVTPAMEAKITDHVWDLSELLR